MSQETKSKALVVRRSIEPKSHYREYREDLRFDFWFSCAYCSLTEIEACGIGFQIDHYYSKKHNPDLVNDYSNLMWSCQKCNRFKLDFDPDEEDISKGHVVIRPDQEDPTDHYDLRELLISGKTDTGHFNIELLDLNRLLLRKIREMRKRFWTATEYVAFGVTKLASMKLDEIDPPKRIAFSRIRQRVQKRDGELLEALDSLLRQFAKSPLLDEDPEKKELLTERRKYLKGIRALNKDAIPDLSQKYAKRKRA